MTHPPPRPPSLDRSQKDHTLVGFDWNTHVVVEEIGGGRSHKGPTYFFDFSDDGVVICNVFYGNQLVRLGQSFVDRFDGI